jgi:hypothetical protein
MSDTTETETLRRDDGDPREKTVRKNGYEVTFYPGFASEIKLKNGDGTEVLFKQEKPFRLPKGHKKPDSKHFLVFKGGKNKQDVRFDIRDPELRIARITVELYEQNKDDVAKAERTTETFLVEEDPITCPPDC